MMNPIIALKIAELEAAAAAAQVFLSDERVKVALQVVHSGAATVPLWTSQLVIVATQMAPLLARDLLLSQAEQTVVEV